MSRETKIIALTGKGGVGKTSISAALVKLLVEEFPEKKILAIDADPAIGLATALGIEPELTLDDIRNEIVANVEDGNTKEAMELLSESRYKIAEAIVEKEGFAFLAIGRPESAGCYCRINSYLKEVIKKDLDLKKIANMVKTRIEVFPEIRDHIDFFEELPEYDIAMYTHKKMKTNAETSLKVLKDVLPILEAQEDFSNDALFAALSAYVSETGVKTGFVMWPVRTAVSGKQMTPAGATEIMEVLGKEESLKRIRKGIEMLEA